MKKWVITYENQPAGEAILIQQGLFYKVVCRLFGSYQEKCRIEILQPKGSIDMGICVPYESFFGCIKLMPIKCLNIENLQFFLRKEKAQKIFMAIRSGEPFVALWKIPESKLTKQGSDLGIIITK